MSRCCCTILDLPGTSNAWILPFANMLRQFCKLPKLHWSEFQWLAEWVHPWLSQSLKFNFILRIPPTRVLLKGPKYLLAFKMPAPTVAGFHVNCAPERKESPLVHYIKRKFSSIVFCCCLAIPHILQWVSAVFFLTYFLPHPPPSSTTALLPNKPLPLSWLLGMSDPLSLIGVSGSSLGGKLYTEQEHLASGYTTGESDDPHH